MNIKQKREEAKMSQSDLARVMGVTQATISYWENNKTIPNAFQLLKLSEVLKCEMRELLLS